MPSEQTPNQTTPQSPGTVPQGPNQRINPELSDTVAKIRSAATPDDLVSFLRSKGALNVPENNVPAVELTGGDPAETPPAPEPTPTPIVPEVPTAEPLNPPVAEPSQETPESSQETPDPSQEPAKPTPAESIVNLRKSLSEEKKRAKALETEKATLAKKIEEYDTGAAVPEALKKKDEEIQRLSTYEKLHNLKGSAAYRAKYIEPLNAAGEKLKSIAKDYKIPEKVLLDAVNLTNRADLNRFLVQHFDDVGALEVKEIIGGMQKLRSDARAAETEPEQALSNLQAEHNLILQAQEVERVGKISTKSKDAWVKAIGSIKNDGKAQELILREDDTDHNEKIVKPILESASKEYGKVVKILGEHGIKDLPEEVAFVLAKSMLLAHGASLAIHSREVMRSEYEKVMRNANRDALHDRPPIGSAGVSSNGSSKPKAPTSMTPIEGANSVLAKLGFPT